MHDIARADSAPSDAIGGRPATPAAAGAAIDLGPLVTADDYDWADQRIARAASAVELLAADAVAGLPRLDRLIVVRESDRYDRKLLDGAMRQAWARNSDAPDLDTIRAAGMDPLDNPEACPFEVTDLSEGRFRAVFFVVGNVGWVYSPSSAKLLNSRGDNDFNNMLCALVLKWRPVVLDSVSFARLVRSLEQGPRLGATCAECVDVVHAGSYTLDFKDHREIAQLLWTILSTMASAERDEIQRMKVAGVLVAYKRGDWPQHLYHTPFGYTYNPETSKLQPDPSQREAVQTMLRILTSGQPATAQITQLIALGVLPGRPSNSRSALRTLIRWSVLYVNGVWIQRYANPMPGLNDWMGLPVVRDRPGDLGWFELVYQPGVPADGWADEALLSEVLALLRATRRKRRGGKRSRHGLAGFAWEGPIGTRIGRREWRMGVDHDRYDIRVRPRKR